MPSQSKQVSSFAGKAVSEQAMEHSAPSPSKALFETKLRVSLLELELKFCGPDFWQNLREAKYNSCLLSIKCAGLHLWFCSSAVLLCVGQVEDRTRDQQRWTRAVSLWQEKVLLRYNSSADLEVDSALGALPVDLPLLRSEPYCLSRPNCYGLRTQHQDSFHIIYVNNKEDQAGHLHSTTHWEHLDMSIFAHMYYLVATHVQLNCAIKLCNLIVQYVCCMCFWYVFIFVSF